MGRGEREEEEQQGVKGKVEGRGKKFPKYSQKEEERKNRDG